MRLCMVLGAFIVITLINASFSAEESKHVPSIGGFPMRHKIEKNVLSKIPIRGASKNHGSNIGNYPLTERSNKTEEKNLRPSKGISSVQTSGAAPLLPDRPVLTIKIYEPGHLNKEIDIKRICGYGGKYLKLLILITSAHSHFTARMSIRHTWMNYGRRRDVGIAFVLGRTTNASLYESLNKENYIYGDMIRGQFIDSYINLTLKTISLLEWTDTHCPRVKYILKTDDDTFINVPKLLDFIDGHKDNRTIYGHIIENAKPHRQRAYKYFLPYHQYGGSVYPPFVTGTAYLLTGDIVHELYVHSLRTYYIQLEDIFTAVLVQSLKIKIVNAGSFYNTRIPFLPCRIRNAISVHDIKENEIYDIWRKQMDSTVKCN
ncbi:beta-1,3-galactosyltransferase 5-like isoform X8 [Drosophila pseudoobscura]|uniref:Hexosyltransferase n=1 Tax=Drosophila pseudoobscura pseudoobscura TaxID=46245 RepID=A0A6I8VVZ3_DROPS|nr:beta-1,3-galactosyltransferase 5 isoform X8 [Drosophila pseudoobscura]